MSKPYAFFLVDTEYANAYTVYATEDAPSAIERLQRYLPTAERFSEADAIEQGWTRPREATELGRHFPAGFATTGERQPKNLKEAIADCLRATKDRLASLENDEASRTPGDRLRIARGELEMDLAEAAEKLGVTVSTYHQYETGRRSPTLDKLHEIATAWGIDPHSLDLRLASTKGKA